MNHQDADSVFRTGLVDLNDSSTGRLHVSNIDFPEKFDSGGFSFIGPPSNLWCDKMRMERRLPGTIVYNVISKCYSPLELFRELTFPLYSTPLHLQRCKPRVFYDSLR